MTQPITTYDNTAINGSAAEPDVNVWETSSTQQYELGTRYVLPDGRAYRYAQAGAAALAPGELQQSAVFGGSSATVQTDIAVQAAAAVGEKAISVTLATDAATLNQYAGGWLCVSDAAGQGQLFSVASNAVATAGGTCVIQVNEPVTVALTTSSKAQLMTNPYKLIIAAPVTTPSGLPVGVPNVDVAINYFGWIQTWGPCCCLVKTALLMGTSVIQDVAAAGSVGVQTAGAASLVQPQIGIGGLVTATTDSGIVFLTIAP